MSIQAADMADVQVRIGRRCKTAPLRQALLAMAPNEAINVVYYDAETGEGFKPSTVAQVVGAISRASKTVKFSVRSASDRRSCYVLCLSREA